MDEMPTYDYIQLLIKRFDIDAEDDIEAVWRLDFALIEDNIFFDAGRLKEEQQINTFLLSYVNRNPDDLPKLVQGFLYGILSSPEHLAREYLKFMSWIITDKFSYCINQLSYFILEKFHKATDVCKKQIFWVIKEFITMDIKKIKKCIISLMKHIICGNLAKDNIWLIESLTDLCLQYKNWIYTTSKLLPHILYNFLSIIEDHIVRDLDQLKEKEIELCVTIIREKFSDIRIIGRDLVRLLHGLVKIPEIKQVWELIVNEPRSLDPTFNGVWDLLNSPTDQFFYAQRLTPDMEKTITFMLRQVVFGSQTRHQEWFRIKYLTQPPGVDLICPVGNLLPHIIRYVVCAFHPDNTLLSSKMLPRWALLGWLMKIKTMAHVASNMKMALLYDWLFFSHTDNIMNIEPAILLITQSLKREFYDVAASLLEFLIFQAKYYDSSDTAHRVRQGVTNSLAACLEKRVIPDLSSIFSSLQSFPDSLRNFILEESSPFSKFLPQRTKSSNGASGKRPRDGNQQDVPFPQKKKMRTENVESEKTPPPKPHVPNVVNEQRRKELGIKSNLNFFDSNLEKLVVQMNQNDSSSSNSLLILVLGTLLEQGKSQERNAKFLQAVKDLAALLTRILSNELSATSSTNSLLLENNHTYCEIFKFYLENPKSTAVCTLVKEMRELQGSYGFRFLCFLFSSRNIFKENQTSSDQLRLINEESISSIMDSYLDHLSVMSGNSVEKKILSDFSELAMCNIETFLRIVPYLFKFVGASVGNPDLVKLLCTSLYPSQLSSICYRLKMNEFEIIGNTDIIFPGTLEWTSFQQFCFWRVAEAEFFHKDTIQNILALLNVIDPQRNYEALDGINRILCTKLPTDNILKAVLSLRSPFSLFVTDLIVQWERHTPDDFLISLYNLMKGVEDQAEAKKLLSHFRILLKMEKYVDLGWMSSKQFQVVLTDMMNKYNLTSDIFSLSKMDVDEGSSSVLTGKERSSDSMKGITKKTVRSKPKYNHSHVENISAFKEYSIHNTRLEKLPN